MWSRNYCEDLERSWPACKRLWYCFSNQKFHYEISEIFFIRITVNNWKKKCNDGDWTVIRRIRRSNLVNSGILKKVKDIALGTRMAGGVINRCKLISRATVVVRANNTNLLKEYGGDLVFTNKWVSGVLGKLTWSKCKGRTGKVDPSPSFWPKKSSLFRETYQHWVSEHDIPSSLMINIDQTSLPHVNKRKYTFSFKAAKTIPIKSQEDQGEITGFETYTFAMDYWLV